ncbi:MAG: sialate O-acetylesterase [Bacteroidales bacterium]|nr:sialate O-acetylesterase [Bacteroidales bacterium]
MKRILLSLSLALLAFTAGAAVKLPAIISDNMVLQRETQVALWGTADGKTVSVTPSWSGTPVSAKVGRDGSWSLRLDTPKAGGPYEISFSDGSATLSVKNILIGEVWLCSGQSNMSMPMSGFAGQPIEGALEVILDANPQVPVRMCMVGRKASLSPEKDCKLSWKENTPEAASRQGAVSYLFALRLQKVLGVPVGVINTSWGGSYMETWISKEAFAKDWPDVKIPQAVSEKSPHHQATLLFNGMVAPLIPFTFKGIVWYQGESNRPRAKDYARLTATYVEMMRTLWNAPEMPFYAVQIAPYNYSNPQGPVFLMEAQEKADEAIPHTGLARTLDIGDFYTIHPPRKREVADRLAALALSHDYGLKGIAADAPVFKAMKVDGAKITLSFDLKGSNLGPVNKPLEGFEVAGEDKVFHPAEAKVSGNKKGVVVVCKEVEKPVAVRYAFHNYAQASLFNDFGIPVGPFRSDDWDQ